jgi:glycosyltransferase involved in cell wall biosynthesis
MKNNYCYEPRLPYTNQSKRVRILEVIDSLYAGGAESLLKNFLIEAKKYNDFEIEVCTLYSRNIFEEELANNGIKIHNLNLSFKYNPIGVFKLLNVIKRGNYDIIHVHLFPADIFVAISSLFLPKRIKFIFSEHNDYNRRRSIKSFKVIDGFTYSRYDKIVCVSKQVEKALIKWCPKTACKVIVIKNAIPISDKLNFERGKLYDIIFVGRLEKQKGIDVLLKAIQILKEKYHRSLRVAIVGDGSLVNDLKELALQYGINEYIDFLGVRKDVLELMRESSIFVLSSRWEGFGLVLLEAMSIRVPVVATKVGGIPEVIEDGKDGILVEPENPDELAKAINLLLSNPDLRNNISESAFRKVKEQYSIENYAKNLLSFYREVVGESSKGKDM